MDAFGIIRRLAPALKGSRINRGSNPVPATTFIITHSPSRSNDRDGLRSFHGTLIGPIGLMGCC